MDISELSKSFGEQNLQVINIDGWSLIQRATFDIQIEEEPYNSIQIYVNLASKKYSVRVWGRSIRSGKVDTAQAWLPDGYSRIFRIACVWPFGLLDYGSATLRCKI